MWGGIYSSERIRICITVAVHHHHTVYQSWAHVITVATISHRFKATNFDSCHITAKYCVEKLIVDSEGQTFFVFYGIKKDLIRVVDCREPSSAQNTCRILFNTAGIEMYTVHCTIWTKIYILTCRVLFFVNILYFWCFFSNYSFSFEERLASLNDNWRVEGE